MMTNKTHCSITSEKSLITLYPFEQQSKRFQKRAKSNWGKLKLPGNFQFCIAQHESNHVHQKCEFFNTFFAPQYNSTVTVA